jgi:glycosyltransferase involved in cell wall biosynthesis
MRGFLGDEFAEAGAWRAGGIKHRIVARAERWLLGASAAVVVLTERARLLLRDDARFASLVRGKDIVVVPCGVEIARFVPARDRRDVLAYVGSVGTWYLLDEMIRFFNAYRRVRPGARLEIANQGQHDLIARAIASGGVGAEATVRSVAFDDIPAFLAGCSAGIVLLREGGSKIASSPIKAAEYLASGLPVVVNGIVGDLPDLLSAHRAGVVLRGLDAAQLDEGARALRALLDDPGVHARARSLAEAVYDVEDGARRYGDLYARLRARR